MEEEGEILHHFCHSHPLKLIEKSPVGDSCDGCLKYFSGEEGAYRCSRKSCKDEILLHEECAEMPREIRHPMHPPHILRQRADCFTRGYYYECEVCGRDMERLGYTCDFCRFYIHLGCVPIMGNVIDAADDQKQNSTIKHDSHPAHELRLLRRRHSFRCDACGTIQKGNSYICITCCGQYCIHESCASLPTTMEIRENLHHHPLSLAFHLPQQYIKFYYKCDICRKDLLRKPWVYHCELCSYVVHIKCAINPSPATTTSINNANAADDKDVTQFPINNASEELIKPFVTRERGEMVIPHDENINGKYQFHSHHHQLSLISSEENGDDDDDEEEDDDLNNRRGRSELICDGCATPIYRKEQKSSSSSSPNSDKYYYYMSCGECKYFLHLACFHLPPELPSHPLHTNCNHKLMLQTCPKLYLWMCRICDLNTNGLMYACTECDFKVDIKCASLPNTIKHAAHPHHYLKQLNEVVTRDDDYLRRLCGCCGGHTGRQAWYGCDSCEFILHCRCALLPPANKERWEKHPLPLTYDANVNHPAEFYCDTCEEEMNPKQWMYHCRECDHSFHPDCFPTTSGGFRNIKFGQQYLITTCHPHPLTFVRITTKLRCDLCNDDEVYGERGFQCATCNFVMCIWDCYRKHRDAFKAID